MIGTVGIPKFQLYARAELAQDVPPSPAPGDLFKTLAVPDTMDNPQVGPDDAAPALEAGDLHSPQFLGTEQQYFKEARRLIESAKKGDMVALQMYEFENAATDGDKWAAKQAPGYLDQQALLPGLTEAAKRGVQVEVILDASKNPRTGEFMNGPIVDALVKAGKKTKNLSLDFYPPNTVNIDHAKQLLYLTPGDKGTMKVQEALVGGSNWGNHTPANDDGGAAFYGRDAVGAAQIFFRDQAFARGDSTAPALPAQDPGAAVQWAVNAPVHEGGGSGTIKTAKMSLINEADDVYLNQYCLTNVDLVAAVAAKGKHAHARLDPGQAHVNEGALNAIRASGGEAVWANTLLDVEHMPNQKNHEKLDVYTKNGKAFALTLGSANDTGHGLEFAIPKSRPNHEIDAVVRRVDEGAYSTGPLLDAAYAKMIDDFTNRSAVDPPKVADLENGKA